MTERFAVCAIVAIGVSAVAIGAGGAPRAAKSDSVLRTSNAVRPPFHGARPSLIRRARGYLSVPSQIQHIVVIYMENRTVDDLFAAYYNDRFTGMGGRQTWGAALDLYDPHAQPTLSPNALGALFDPDHSHLDGFTREAAGQWSAAKKGCPLGGCPPGASVFSYVPKPEPDPYAAFIENFAYASHVLQSNEGPSFAAHQYAIAGQSGGIVEDAPPEYAPHAQAENPGTPAPMPKRDGGGDYDEKVDTAPQGNCYGPSTFTEETVDMNTSYPGTEPPVFDHPPCAEYPTILDSIAAVLHGPADADWQYIASLPQGIWAAPMAVNHLFTSYNNHRNKAAEPFAIDPDALNLVQNLTPHGHPSPVRPFAALTYITPCFHESDHPITKSDGGAVDGPQWLAYVVNAIGNSSYWPTTTIIVTWDDWGGFFDHYRATGNPKTAFHPVPNPYGNGSDPNEWGFRVPLIVISPYVKSRGYVSSRLRSQGAILNYIESTFGLPSLQGDDMTNGADNLGDLFDGNHQAYPYIPVPNTFDPAQALGHCRNG